MKDSDDMNSIRHHRVVDDVTAYELHALSVTHVVALHPNRWIIRKRPDSAVQLNGILVRLKFAPLLERAPQDIDKITLG